MSKGCHFLLKLLPQKGYNSSLPLVPNYEERLVAKVLRFVVKASLSGAIRDW
jgi:hypothetical protein